MANQRKTFTLSDEAVDRLETIHAGLAGVGKVRHLSDTVEHLILQDAAGPASQPPSIQYQVLDKAGMEQLKREIVAHSKESIVELVRQVIRGEIQAGFRAMLDEARETRAQRNANQKG